MPIQPIQFPTLSFDQANPALAAARANMDIFGQGLDSVSKVLAQRKASAELPYAADLAKSTAAYKTAMANYLSSPNQALKYMSTLGKTYVEPSIVQAILRQNGVNTGNRPVEGFTYSPQGNEQGGNPTETPDQNPGQPGSINDFYGLQRQKMTSDSQARNRNLFATNIEKTLSYINPDDLTRYGGAAGSFNRLIETGKSAFGKESKDYDNFVKSQNAVKLLTKQIRQFYGDSIQPSMQQNLEILNNPASWSNNPELSKEIFNQTVNILKNELGTYREALKTPKAYQEQNIPQQATNNIAPASKALSKALELPSFNSAQEFQSWYLQQPKMVQDAVDLRLGKKK